MASSSSSCAFVTCTSASMPSGTRCDAVVEVDPRVLRLGELAGPGRLTLTSLTGSGSCATAGRRYDQYARHMRQAPANGCAYAPFLSPIPLAPLREPAPLRQTRAHAAIINAVVRGRATWSSD